MQASVSAANNQDDTPLHRFLSAMADRLSGSKESELDAASATSVVKKMCSAHAGTLLGKHSLFRILPTSICICIVLWDCFCFSFSTSSQIIIFSFLLLPSSSPPSLPFSSFPLPLMLSEPYGSFCFEFLSLLFNLFFIERIHLIKY